jgi:hypothetical protein
MTTLRLPPPLPRAGRMRTRIIVVVWTLLCLVMGAALGEWLEGPRVIKPESASQLSPIHPVVRCEQWTAGTWRATSCR